MIEKTLPDSTRLKYRYHESGPGADQLATIQRKNRLGNTEIIRVDKHATQGLHIKHGNGLRTTQDYQQNKLVGLNIEGLSNFTYHYNQNHLIVGIDRDNKIFQRYRYNALGQLDFALTPHALFKRPPGC